MNKTLTALIILAAIGFSSDSNSQQLFGFNPRFAPAFRAPFGSKVTFQTTFEKPFYRGVPPEHIYLRGLPGISAVPSDFIADYDGYGVGVTITVIDSTTCLQPTDGMGAFNSAGQPVDIFYVSNGVFYDPNLINHARIMPSGTINFGAVKVGGDSSQSFEVGTGSLDNFRTFSAIDVRSPFQVADPIPLSYHCGGPGTGGPNIPSGASFHPTIVGRFTDTAYLLDPLTNDSIPLILIGEAVAAGVAGDPPAPQFHMFPNPCDRTLNVWLSGEEASAIEIWNVMREKVYSYRGANSELSVDCSALPAGVYFAQVRTKDRIIGLRLIVAH
ncbi:MAG: T9SS type A sorting domain-containing protein [Bacteroidota bacterium]|nr:T9SS type A sorting domain-containing protein [Bacteroidota bacterium]MDP4232339.1 T9SS type A sorting domain-containing protein [Bacteroidota bacterium]MDP4241478.1 T9SS type A sorting domain-containing protein [Bacteroidota bacterium]MDP4286698.1 T9SS type A sorting domain-containing protein [Bacteroidota bacterium]